MADSFQVFPIEVETAEDTTEVFSSIDAIRDWLAIQQDFTAFLGQVGQHEGSLNPFRRHLEAGYNAIAQTTNSLEQAIARDDDSADTPRKQLIEEFDRWFVRKHPRLANANSWYADALKKISATEPVLAGYMLAHLLGYSQNFDFNQPVVRAAVWKAEALANGFSGAEASLRSQLETLLGELNQELSATRATGSKVAQDYQTARKAAARLGRILRRNFSTQLNEQSGSFDKMHVEALDRLASLEDTYDKKLALSSAVSYWTNKARTHKRVAIAMTIATTGIVSVGIWIVGLAVLQLIQSLASTTDQSLWPLGVIAVYGTILIYVMRLLVRFTMSQFHLHEDAQQRAVMTQAYLALLKEGTALGDDDRRLVLEILFRPMNAGLIKDDSSMTPYDVLMARLTRPGS